MACIKDCDAPVVSRNYIYLTSWELRNRTGTSGDYNVHDSDPRTEDFNAAFHSLMGSAMNTIYSYANAEGHGNIQWIGTAGAQVCKTGCHSNGNALDITAVKFVNTSFDMKASWRSNQSLAQQRGYLAIWAGLRIFCKTVLGNGFVSNNGLLEHQDHFHVDNDGNGLSAPPAIRDTAQTDTLLVQHACNLLNDANLTIDGDWGSATTKAYNSLIEALNMDCLSPKTNYWHARTFLILLMRHGFASESAGEYIYPYCG